MRSLLVIGRCMFASLLAACSFEGRARSLDGGDSPDAPRASDATIDDATRDAPVGCGGACPWGCTAGTTTCAELAPAGGAVTGADLDATGLAAVSVTTSIDGSTGRIDGVTASTVGATFHVAGNVAVFRFAALTITGDITLSGNRAIALVSAGRVTIAGAVLGRGPCSATNPTPAGPGGGAGRDEANGAGPFGGDGGSAQNDSGGGGGNGGAGGDGVSGNLGGGQEPDLAITVLAGGSGGGGGKTSRGGGGGGALQIVSNDVIVVTATGGIDLGGCGGGGGDGNADAGGGGGGAGGTLLLEAPRLEVAGFFAVNGGGGGTREDVAGAMGRRDRSPAAGASGAGAGGAGATFAGGAGTGGANDQPNGGGGGGVGRMRFNTRDGTAGDFVQLSGFVSSPSLADAGAPVTLARAARR